MPAETVQTNLNTIQDDITKKFLPRFGKGCQLVYVRPADEMDAHPDESLLEILAVTQTGINALPAVTAFDKEKGWLYLIEVSSAYPCITEARILLLRQQFSACKAELIFISAFLTRQDYTENILDIAWESEVWLADNPEHMIHFNGDKFLGPYKKSS